MSAMLRLGDPLPELTFLKPDGSSQLLTELQTPLLLIFLRHLR